MTTLKTETHVLRSINQVCKCNGCYHPPPHPLHQCSINQVCKCNGCYHPPPHVLRSINQVCKCNGCYHPPPHVLRSMNPVCKCNGCYHPPPHPPTCRTVKKSELPRVLNDAGSKNNVGNRLEMHGHKVKCFLKEMLLAMDPSIIGQNWRGRAQKRLRICQGTTGKNTRKNRKHTIRNIIGSRM